MKVLDQWVGDAVGTMHRYGITKQDLADETGKTRQWIWAVLHQKKTPANAQELIETALKRKIHEMELR